MTAAPSIVPLSGAEISLYEAFRTVEMSVDGKRPLAEEMILAVSRERDQLGDAMRRANQVYGASFDVGLMRRYVVLRYVIDLLERVAERKSELAPILYPELAPRRARRT